MAARRAGGRTRESAGEPGVKALAGLLRELVAKLEREVPYASALAAETTGATVHVGTYHRSVGFKEPARGVTLTVFTGTEFVERTTVELSPGALRRAASELLAEARRVGVARRPRFEVDPGARLERDFAVAMDQDPRGKAPAELVAVAAELHDRVKAASPRVVNATAALEHGHATELFVNRNKVLFQELHLWQTAVHATLGSGDHRSEFMAGHCRQGGLEHLALDGGLLERKASLAERLLHAERVPAGTHDCVFSPSVAGLLAHESLGHGTETDMYLKGRARGHAFMGKRVGAPCVDLFDSPAAPGLPASFFFDHEGQLAAETQIIRGGVLVSGLTDLNSAMRLGYQRTPNGRRENVGHKVYARMTNTYFGPGTDRLDAMVASVHRGFLVDEERNGMEDPKGWGIQLETLGAREIRDGRLTDRWFGPVIVTGTVPELLDSVTMVGDRVEMSTLGLCGKGYKEMVRASFGGPYLRLRARLA